MRRLKWCDSMGLIKKIFRWSGGEKDEISKFDDRSLTEKEIQLKNKSKKLLTDIRGTENEINHLVEESKGKSQNEKTVNAIRIKTLQEKKQALESALVAVEKQLRASDGIVNVKIGDEISTIGITDEIDDGKMSEAVIDRRIKAQETDEKVTNITQNISRSISSTKLDEDAAEVLDILNEMDEGDLEPEQVAKQLSRDVE